MSTIPAPATVRRRRAPFVFAAGLGVALAADVAFDPAHRHVPLCPFHAATGAWCPLCGGLRAANALARGQWTTAFHDNALFLGALPLIAVWWFDWLLRSRRGEGSPRVRTRAVLVVVLVAVAFTVVRNLPFATTLRP
jgi:hypothetical protein